LGYSLANGNDNGVSDSSIKHFIMALFLYQIKVRDVPLLLRNYYLYRSKSDKPMHEQETAPR
jgi:hypothetical protein